jgi:glycosyltransferase involved in cell wall biosynthesis
MSATMAIARFESLAAESRNLALGSHLAGASVRVSVLVLAYQHERYIAQALDGVLEQRIDVPYEIVVGDDASTDGTREVIAAYASAHSDRVRTIMPTTNLGMGGKPLIRELIRQARGEYVAMLDGDDFWTSPTKLARQVAFLDRHPECSMCFHNVVRVYEDRSQPDSLYNRPGLPDRFGFRELLSPRIPSCSTLFRREAIHPLPDWYLAVPWWDWPLFMLAATRGEVHYFDEVMGVYRIHGEGLYSSLSELEALEQATAFYVRIAELTPKKHEPHRRRVLADSWAAQAHVHRRLGDRDAARRCLRESFQAWPPDPRRLYPGRGEKRRIGLWIWSKWPRPFMRDDSGRGRW